MDYTLFFHRILIRGVQNTLVVVLKIYELISKNFVVVTIKKSSYLNYFFDLFFLFVTVSASTFFTLMRRYLMSFAFFTTWHK